MGALVTGFLLVRRLGFDQAIWVGVLLNGLCVLGAGLLGTGSRGVGAAGRELAAPTVANRQAHPLPVSATTNIPFAFWTAQYFLSGLAALSLELVWFRVIETLIKSVSLTFAVLLAIYLGSMAVGTWIGTRFSGWSARGRERLFLLAQMGLYAYTVGAMVLFINAVPNLPGLRFLWDYFASGEPVLSPRLSVFTYGAVPLFLLFVPTFLMGLCFTLSQSLIHNRPDEVGRRVGWLQFVNIAGSALGAWAVTWLGFPLLGTAPLLRIAGALGLVYIALLVYRKHLSLLGSGVLGAGLLAMLWLVPDNAHFWQLLNGLDQPERFLFHENESAVSVIKLDENRQLGTVYVNGLGQSSLPYNSDNVHVLLGALPLMMHPNPEYVAVIGLGSAGTVNGIGGRSETNRIDCFELATNQPDVLRQYAAVTGDTSVSNVLTDKRLRLILHDGRYAIRNGGTRYDIIEADALRPLSAYSGNVYSKEYFELIRSRLRSGGFAVTWCPTARVLHTFRMVFPHVVNCDNMVLIGSDRPITVDWQAVGQRAGSAFSQRHYGRSGITLAPLLTHYEHNTHTMPPLRSTPTEINTDLFPKDEYSIRVSDRASF